MANRDGEFAVVVDPGDDGHTVAVYALNRLLGALEQTLQSGLRAEERDAPRIELFITASPETGSVRFWLMVGVALGVSANVSQVAGVNVRDVVTAVSNTISAHHIRPPSSPVVATISSDPHFVDSVTRLVEVASETGYKSVRIEANGLKVELIERAPADFEDTVDRLRKRLDVLERRAARLAPPAPYVDNVRRVDSERAQLEHEISGVEHQLERLERLRRSDGPHLRPRIK